MPLTWFDQPRPSWTLALPTSFCLQKKSPQVFVMSLRMFCVTKSTGRKTIENNQESRRLWLFTSIIMIVVVYSGRCDASGNLVCCAPPFSSSVTVGNFWLDCSRVTPQAAVACQKGSAPNIPQRWDLHGHSLLIGMLCINGNPVSDDAMFLIFFGILHSNKIGLQLKW